MTKKEQKSNDLLIVQQQATLIRLAYYWASLSIRHQFDNYLKTCNYPNNFALWPSKRVKKAIKQLQNMILKDFKYNIWMT